MKIAEKDRNWLLSLARRSLEEYLDQRRPASSEDPPEPALLEPRGAFVTLRLGNSLRGCIGFIEPVMPLAEAVRRLAVDAAFRDPRFSPLTIGELPRVRLEISVLTVPRRVSDPGEINIPGDGVIVRHGEASGVFLPQVAEETGWNREQFLDALCTEKAGLPADCWRDGEAELYTFRAERFSEPDPSPSGTVPAHPERSGPAGRTLDKIRKILPHHEPEP